MDISARVVVALLDTSSWAAVRTRYEVSDERVVLEGELPTSLRGSEFFFEVSAFVTRSIPTFVGYPKAEVESTFSSHGFRAVVPLPRSRAIPARVRQAVAERSGDAVRFVAAILGDLPIALDGMMAGRRLVSATERGTAAARAWGLTSRESETLALLVEGRCNKDIAAALGCSPRTAETHVARVIAKSGCATRAEVSARYWSLA